MKRERLLLAAAAACLAAGCGGLSDRGAAALVREYDRRLVEAYRAGDVRIVEPVVGPAQARRLAGLIGVKLDMGITLDAELLDLAVEGVERHGGEVKVRTSERWRYADRRIGSGERVGEESTDRYRMSYTLGKSEGRWVVVGLDFAEPPEVGRREASNRAPATVFHGSGPSGPAAVPAPRTGGEGPPGGEAGR